MLLSWSRSLPRYGMYAKQVKQEVKPPLMAYSFGNVCTKNYWNRMNTVKLMLHLLTGAVL